MGMFDALFRGVQDLGAKLRDMRAELESARKLREDIANAPAAREDVKALYSRWIDEFCPRQYERLLAGKVDTLLRKGTAYFDDLHSTGPRNLVAALAIPGVGGADPARVVDIGLMALLGPQLKPALMKAIDNLDWPADAGLPRAERARRIAALDAKIAQLQGELGELEKLAAANRIIID